MIWLRVKRDGLGRIVRDDAGSALILALAFLIFFSFIGAALLAFVETGFKGSVAVNDQRQTSYSADAGIEGAIRYIQASPSRGSVGNCPDFVTPINGPTVTVRCSPFARSREPILGGSGTDSPQFALLALDDNLSNSGLDQGSGGNLDIDGATFSNSRISVSSGALLNVTGTVWARGACDNARITPDCTPTSTIAADPQYPPQSTAFDGTNTDLPPVCVGDTATFTPGKYTFTPEDPSKCSSGNGITTNLFLPGVYYFEFTGSGLWKTKSTTKIVGGTPDPGDPNGCLTGVQFIFGGTSRLELQNNSSLLLCAKPPSGQRIAIFGAGSVVRLKPLAVTTSGSGGTAFTPATPGAINAPDSLTAMATMSATNQQQSLVGTGFNQGWNGSSLASNGNISSAKLRIRHRESSNTAVSATVAPADGSAGPITLVSGSCSGVPAPCSSSLTASNSMHENTYELTQISGWNSPTRYNGVTVTFMARTTGSGTSTRTIELDVAWIDVIYAPSPFKAASGSLISDSSRDPLLKSPNSSDFRMKVTGTVYAPASLIDLQLGNDCNQALGRGVISWRVKISLTSSCAPLRSPISLPPSGIIGYQEGQVLLESYVGCSPGVATCTPKARAKVRFPVGTGNPIVDYWIVIRT